MRKGFYVLLVGVLAVSCVSTTKVYRAPFYKMNKRDVVYIEKADSSFIYSDAQLEKYGDAYKFTPDKKVESFYRIDSLLYKELKSLRYKPQIIAKGIQKEAKGIIITYKDYWINESDPSFYRFWLKGMSLKDSSVSMIYEGAAIQSTGRNTPVKEVRQSILELITPGIEQEPDETDYYVSADDDIFPKSNFYLAANYGTGKCFGNSLSNVDPSEVAHRDALKKGTIYNGDLAYFFKPFYGAGVTFSSFASSTEKGTIVDQINPSKNRYLSDQIAISYVGPAFYVRNLFFKGRMSAVFSASAGYLSYKDTQKEYTKPDFSDATPLNNNMSANGAGGKLGVSLEYIITPNVGVGLSAGLGLGRLSVTDPRATDNPTQKLWMNHFSIGLGLRLYK